MLSAAAATGPDVAAVSGCDKSRLDDSILESLSELLKRNNIGTESNHYH